MEPSAETQPVGGEHKERSEMALGKYYATGRADTLSFFTCEGQKIAYFECGGTELKGTYEIKDHLIKVCWTKKIWSKPGRSQRIEDAVEIREEMAMEENYHSARFRDGLYRHQHLVGEDDDWERDFQKGQITPQSQSLRASATKDTVLACCAGDWCLKKYLAGFWIVSQ